MIPYLMSQIGAGMVDTQVSRVDIIVETSIVTLETVWNKGDGNLVAQQRLLMNALYHATDLTNYFMSYVNGRNKSNIIVRGMATPNHEIYPTAYARRVVTPVRLNYIDLHVNPVGHSISAQVTSDVTDAAPYVHGINLRIRQGTPVTQVATALRATLHKIMMQHKVSTPKVPHSVVVQRIYPGIPREVHNVATFGDYENTIEATVTSFNTQLTPNFMRATIGRPLRKPRYGK